MISFTSEQRILITGASSGIGRATALLLHSLGATVIASGRNRAALEFLLEESGEPERMLLAPRDLLLDMDSIPGWIRSLVASHGKLSGLVCSAGVDIPMSLQMFTPELAHKVFDVNYSAPMLLARGFTDRRCNTGCGAAIVFLASIAATQAMGGKIAYAGSKAALISSAKCISREVASLGIRVNCISPGALGSPMANPDLDRFYSKANLAAERNSLPLGPGSADEVAALVAFLLSDRSSWITGQNYVLDGGQRPC